MSIWRRANLVDRMYLVYFAGVGTLILLLRDCLSGWPTFLALHAVCIVVVVTLVLSANRFPAARAWYPLLMPLIMFEEVAQLNFLIVDGWQDRYLLELEAALFSEPPTVWLARHSSLLLTEILQIGYLSYFIMLIVVAGSLYRRPDQAGFFGVMAATVLSYLVCYFVFVIFPTEGPAHTLRHLHTTPIPGGPLYGVVSFVQKAGVHGNAFPSAHVAGAVAPLIFAWRYAPGLAAWLSPLTVLLGIAAVYDRYHYASDVFAGTLVGAAAAGLMLFIQARPDWAGRLNVAPSGRSTSSRRRTD